MSHVRSHLHLERTGAYGTLVVGLLVATATGWFLEKEFQLLVQGRAFGGRLQESVYGLNCLPPSAPLLPGRDACFGMQPNFAVISIITVLAFVYVWYAPSLEISRLQAIGILIVAIVALRFLKYKQIGVISYNHDFTHWEDIYRFERQIATRNFGIFAAAFASGNALIALANVLIVRLRGHHSEEP